MLRVRVWGRVPGRARRVARAGVPACAGGGVTELREDTTARDSASAAGERGRPARTDGRPDGGADHGGPDAPLRAEPGGDWQRLGERAQGMTREEYADYMRRGPAAGGFDRVEAGPAQPGDGTIRDEPGQAEAPADAAGEMPGGSGRGLSGDVGGPGEPASGGRAEVAPPSGGADSAGPGDRADVPPEAAARIAELEALLAAKDAQIAAKDAEIAAEDAEIAAKDAEIAGKDAELGEARGRLGQAEGELARTRDRLGEAVREIAGLVPRAEYEADMKDLSVRYEAGMKDLRAELRAARDRWQPAPGAAEGTGGDSGQPRYSDLKLQVEQRKPKESKLEGDRTGKWSNAKINLYGVLGGAATLAAAEQFVPRAPHPLVDIVSAAPAAAGALVPVLREGLTWKKKQKQ
jgi:hypothetical protein